jgi:hypothetical protein
VHAVAERVEELQESAIPELDRLFVGAYVDEHFQYDARIDRLSTVKLFGRLVSEEIGRRGLRHTVAVEVTDFGKRVQQAEARRGLRRLPASASTRH